MNKQDLYEKTVNILVDAYFNDTLQHGSCHSCAVGNICKEAATNLKLDGDEWAAIFYTADGEQYTAFDCGVTGIMGSGKRKEGIELIRSTGYTPRELAKLEYAFETATFEGERMFNGLMAVIDVLDQIHNNTDATTTRATKQRFVKI